ncbi:MAG: PspC domain-containing protein [Parahaliea sp.]
MTRRSYNYDGNLGGIVSRRQRGWGMNLFRNTRQGWIAGVAAGLADHWGMARWVVRMLWITAFIFSGGLAVWVYIGAWILMAPRLQGRRKWAAQWADNNKETEEMLDVEMVYDERVHQYRPRKVFQYSEPIHVRLQRARERLDGALERVEAMESYVTSRHYELNKEFSRL